MAPMITETQAPTRSERYSCSVTTRFAPTTGPRKVPLPPSKVIRITSPEVPWLTSESVTNPRTNALREPAKPARLADKTKATSL